MMRALVGCAGFGGVEIALREFGVDAVGIEIDPAIAEVNRRNGSHCLTADLLDVDPADYAGWFLYHFSPPCPNFSVAQNSKAPQLLRFKILDLARHQRITNGETEIDLALAHKICEFIRIGKPTFFTLENVWGYRKSLSWLLIWYTLLAEGYGVDAWHLNSADYGVPQSRRRMIVIARRDGRQPAKPWPTHSKAGDMFTEPWNGWYEAIEDLIPTLKETQLAPWQRDRWPEELGDYLIMTGNTSRDGIGNKPGRGYLDKEQPANTVSAGPRGGALPKAILINNNTGGKSELTTRSEEEPANTVVASLGSKGAMQRAVLLGQGSRSEPKTADLPADTITANGNQTGIKVIIVNGGNSKGEICQPHKTVAISTRCLARFQGLPDKFILPDEFGADDWIFDEISPRKLSCLGIGNALPPLLYRAVMRSIID